MEIGFINGKSKLSEHDLAFYLRAVNIQMERDFCPAYELEPWPCVGYSDLPVTGVHPIYILDDIETAGALGFHDDVVGLIYGRVMAQGPATASTMSHEACEMRADPTCEEWRPMPDGRSVAFEACDAVEADEYVIPVEMYGETHQVSVSNFVLPAFYDADSPGPYDFMGKLSAPFSMTPGGYLIVRDQNGRVGQVFGQQTPGLSKAMAKTAQPGSRTRRRVLQAGW